MDNVGILVTSDPEPLNEGILLLLLRCNDALREATVELTTRHNVLRRSQPYLYTWGVVYSTFLQDVCGSLTILLKSGDHNRTALIMRRVVFEYFVRFRFYWQDGAQAKTALEDATPRLRLFAERLWDDEELQFIEDPTFNEELHREADETHAKFWQIANRVFSAADAKRFYARFYMHPSWLAHGSSAGTIDILGIEGLQPKVYVKSKRRTNEIGFNTVAFLISFLNDLAIAFDLKVRSVATGLLTEKEELAVRLGIDLIAPAAP